MPEIDQIWKRKTNGKAAVKVGRVWECDNEWLIRCHPHGRGGKWWWTTVEEFLKRYEIS